MTRAGYLYALARWHALAGAGHLLDWGRCGLLQLARDSREETRMRRALAELNLPAAYAEYLPRSAAGERAGRAVSAGGLWFADGGWMRPASLVAAQLAAAAAGASGWTLHAGSEVRRLARADGRWSAIAADGTTIASAPVCVLANAHDAARLAAFGGPPLRRVRGQLTRLPPGSYGAVSAVIAGTATLVPMPDGPVTGASYDFDDADPLPRIESHTGNLARLVQLLPDAPRLDAATLTGVSPSVRSLTTGCR